MSRACLVLAGLSVGCGSTKSRPAGVAKGCRESVHFDRPIVEGLGLSSHLEWGEGDEDVAYRNYEVTRWAELGVKVIRRDLTWATLEPTAGTFEFSKVDRVVDAIDSVAAQFVALLDYGNPAYEPFSSSSVTPPEDPADFARYAEALAEHIGDRVHHYEVWNEQNVGVRFWAPIEDPQAYAALLSSAASAIRRGDPDAFVAMGGLFWPDLGFNTSGPEFLDAVIDAHPSLVEDLDAVPIHPYRYPFTAPEDDSGEQATLTDEICAAREQLDDLGMAATQLWIGELGWHTAPDSLFPGPDPDTHAAWMARAMLLSFAQGAEQFLWYTFRDSGTDEENQEDMFGLVTVDADPTDDVPPEDKPAFSALRTLIEMLDNHDRITDISVSMALDAHTYGYELAGGETMTLVLWTDGPAKDVRVPADGRETITHVSMDGASTQLTATAGSFSVHAGPAPIYLLLGPGVADSTL